jgi:hypothetical protein
VMTWIGPYSKLKRMQNMRFPKMVRKLQRLALCSKLVWYVWAHLTTLPFTANCTSLVENSTCYVVTGATEILLDFFSAQARDEAYAAIRKGLDNPAILQLFASSVLRAQFLQPLSEALVAAGDENKGDSSSSVTVTVAIAAAVVAFILASLICYGLMYEQNKRKSRFRDNQLSSRLQSIRDKHAKHSTRGVPLKVQRNFARLDEAASSSDSSMVDSSFQDPQNYIPSITWSVSDITSDDSGSIRSNLSRTTSKLESIEEGEEDEEPRDKYHVPRKRRGVKEFDCAQFRKGAVYISNLSQCRKALSMPSDYDLKLEIARDLPADVVDVPANAPQSIDINPPDCPGKRQDEQTAASTKKECEEGAKLPMVCDDFLDDEHSNTNSIINNGNGTFTKQIISSRPDQTTPSPGIVQDCGKNQALAEPLNEVSREPTSIQQVKETEAESNDDITNILLKSDKPCSFEDAEASSIETSADGTNSEIRAAEDLLVDDGIEVDLDVFYDVVKDGGVESSERSVNTAESEKKTATIVSNSMPEGDDHSANSCDYLQMEKAIEPDVEVFYDVTNKEFSSSPQIEEEEEEKIVDESLSLYSLDMDDTINTLIDDTKALAISAVLGESILVQLDYSGTSKESTLDDIQLDDSDDSFFVDDLSESDIDDSSRTADAGDYSFKGKQLDYSGTSKESTLDDIQLDDSDDSFFVDDLSESDIDDSSRTADAGDYSFKGKDVLMESKREQILADNTNQPAPAVVQGNAGMKRCMVEENKTMADIV